MAMIQITFTPETPEQAAVVAEAIGKYLGTVPAGGTVAEVKEPVAEAPKRTRKAAVNTPAEPAQSEPTPSQSAPAEAAQEADEGNVAAEPSTQEAPAAQTASSTEPAVSLEQVRAKLSALSQAGKQQQVVALIASMGAKKLTEVAPEKYAKLLAEAEAL